MEDDKERLLASVDDNASHLQGNEEQQLPHRGRGRQMLAQWNALLGRATPALRGFTDDKERLLSSGHENPSDLENNEEQQLQPHWRWRHLLVQWAALLGRATPALWVFAAAISFGVFYYLGQLNALRAVGSSLKPIGTSFLSTTQLKQQFTKPDGLRVVGLLFFGRRQFVDILDCYMRRNLAINGGYLDEIHIVTHTANEADMDWLYELIETHDLGEHYKVFPCVGLNWTANPGGSKWKFDFLWRDYVTENDTIYVKFDDDIVFIEDNAIPLMVESLRAHPEAHSIQANIINGKRTHWFHGHLPDTIRPYLPEPSVPSAKELAARPSNAWRESELPPYPVPSSFAQRKKASDRTTAAYDKIVPTFPGHRWLPLPATAANKAQTPIALAPNPDTKGTLDVPFAMAAVAHYSFFHHLEQGSLYKYAFGAPDTGLWDTNYKHWNINLMVIRGSVLKLTPFWKWGWSLGDEWALTEIAPAALQMPVLVQTRAIVGHYSFHTRGESQKLALTDVLDRYRAYANERVCGRDNQKEKFVFTPVGDV